jgi:hypothetical protein
MSSLRDYQVDFAAVSTDILSRWDTLTLTDSHGSSLRTQSQDMRPGPGAWHLE